MTKIFIGSALALTLLTAVFGVLVKGNIGKLQGTVKESVAARNMAEGNLQVAKKELKKSQEDLLAATTAVEEKDKEVSAKTAQNDALTKQVADAKAAADEKDAQFSILTKKLASAPPPVEGVADPAMTGALGRAEKAEAELAEAKQIEETLNRKLKDYEARMASLEQYKRDRERGFQRSGVSGSIVAVNPGWNFLVLSIGDKQGLMPNSPLLVMRGGEQIAKARVTSIEASRSIADVIPSSVRRGVQVQPGDQVVVEGNRSQPIHGAEPAEPNAPSAAPSAPLQAP